MGKGDKKSRRGKIRIGSFGVRRPKKKKKSGPVIIKAPVKKRAEVIEEKPVVVPEVKMPDVQIMEPIAEKAKPIQEAIVEQAKPIQEPVVEKAKPAQEPIVEKAKPIAEPVVEKTKPKKASAKKPVVKVEKEKEKEETKPKATKSRKKTE